MHTVRAILPGLLVLAVLAGCRKPPQPLAEPYQGKDYSKPLPPGQLALRKITDPNEIPDFSHAFGMRAGLDEAIARSLNYMSKPSSRQFYPYGEITHDQVVASLQEFRRTIQEAGSGDDLNRLIRERFDVYESVGYDNNGIVYFTGYYTPIFDARLQPDATYKYPLYKTPPDLVKDSAGNTIGRRGADGSVTPGYYDRRQLVSSDLLTGQELCYLKDPFEAYIVTVQGSAKLHMADGRFFEIGYDANNGHEYVPISQKLIDDGKLTADQLSLKRLIDYFRQYPNEIQFYTNQNPRYVFFTPRAGGPFGCLNERVTSYRTIATDKQVYPRAAVAFMQTRLPVSEGGAIREKTYHGFALDQDAGGAIRAAGRCDVFLGVGDAAGDLAGRTASEGRLYYLFTKSAGDVAHASPPATE